MCMHYPYGAGVDPTDYVGDLGGVWLLAQILGYVSDTTDPQERLACTNAVGLFDNPVWKPVACCLSFGVHDGYAQDYATDHCRSALLRSWNASAGYPMPARVTPIYRDCGAYAAMPAALRRW